MLVDHLSYSSLTMLARNPLIFKKQYILKIYSTTYSPSAVVGTAAHKFVEHYLKTGNIEAAQQEGLHYIGSLSDVSIDYGKTGSREEILKNYANATAFYMQESPAWDKREILEVEGSITEVIHDANGNAFSIPAKAKNDVLWRSKRKETFAGHTFPKGSLFIEDHKFSKNSGLEDEDDGARIIQAMFNYHVVKEKYGEAPVAMLFREVKWSKNRDGGPQADYYVIRFDQPQYFEFFYQLYNDVTRFLSQPEPIFLPNFQDNFDGKEALLVYRQNLITADAPVEVARKTKEVTFVEPQFVASSINKIENRDYPPHERIRVKLAEFGVPVEFVAEHNNGSVSLYTFKVGRGVRMASLEKYAKDIQQALKSESIRVQAPVVGTDLVGFEVPSETFTPTEFDSSHIEIGSMSIPIGKDVYGSLIREDLRSMPHLLVAGATGTGKSVFLNVAITALSEQLTPEELNLVLIDPKRVEFRQFRDLPHLQGRIVTEHNEAIKTLKWLVDEMDARYEILEEFGARSIDEYNQSVADRLPYLVCVIDEFAELMLTKEPGEPSIAELFIVRLAQKARAVGIHLILGTQSPRVDVVSGLIKANFPTRVAFRTAMRIDSQVILDTSGAEELRGKGDLLFLHPKYRGLIRAQALLK